MGAEAGRDEAGLYEGQAGMRGGEAGGQAVLGPTTGKYKGMLPVYCNPFSKKPFYGSHRLDLVMIRPPGTDHGGFAGSLDSDCLVC